jgi:hypothetical protein
MDRPSRMDRAGWSVVLHLIGDRSCQSSARIREMKLPRDPSVAAEFRAASLVIDISPTTAKNNLSADQVERRGASRWGRVGPVDQRSNEH